MIKTIQKLDLKSINQAIYRQQIVFKREFSVLFDAVKTENVQYLEEKMQPIKRILSKKFQKKNRLKFEF